MRDKALDDARGIHRFWARGRGVLESSEASRGTSIINAFSMYTYDAKRRRVWVTMTSVPSMTGHELPADAGFALPQAFGLEFFRLPDRGGAAKPFLLQRKILHPLRGNAACHNR